MSTPQGFTKTNMVYPNANIGNLPLYKKNATDSYYAIHPTSKSKIFVPRHKFVKLANGTVIELGKHLKKTKPAGSVVPKPASPPKPVSSSPKPASPPKQASPKPGGGTPTGFVRTPYFTYNPVSSGNSPSSYKLPVLRKVASGRYYANYVHTMEAISQDKKVKHPNGTIMKIGRAHV